MSRRFLLVLLATLLLPAARPAAAAPTVIKLATLVPSGSVWDNELRAMAAEVQKRTEGRVTFRIYPGGVAGDDPDVVRKMRLGQLQAGALSIDGLTDLDRGFSVFSVPRFCANFEELFHVTEALTPTLSARLDKEGFVLLAWGTAARSTSSPSSRCTLRRLQEAQAVRLRGRRAMVSGGRQQLPPAPRHPYMMTALQTGMIDALPSPPLVAVRCSGIARPPTCSTCPWARWSAAPSSPRRPGEDLAGRPGDRSGEPRAAWSGGRNRRFRSRIARPSRR
jgi:TRAP-type C4-dicarboxylate transport system substrate-binding protein